MLLYLRLVLLVLVFWCILSTFGADLSDENDYKMVNDRTSGDSENVVPSERVLEEKRKNQTKLNKPTRRSVQKHIANQLQVTENTNKLNKPTEIVVQKKPAKVPIQLTKKTNIPIRKIHSGSQNQIIKKISIPPKKNYQEKDGLDFGNVSSGHGGKKKKKRGKKGKEEKGLMEKVLPMMVTPFIISSSMVPMMLISMIVMLVKSAFIGKIGIILMLINMFTNRRNPGAVTSHDINMDHPGNLVAMEHYGWHGDEEYGAYVNRKRR